MLKKVFRELHDGLGTVLIGLKLPKIRLDRLQENSDLHSTSVDSIINDAINQYLVFTEMRASNKKSIFELPQKVEELEKENRILKSAIDTLSTRKRVCRTQKKKHESSPLQLYLALERPLGIRIEFIETETAN